MGTRATVVCMYVCNYSTRAFIIVPFLLLHPQPEEEEEEEVEEGAGKDEL